MNDKQFSSTLNALARIRALEDRIVADTGMSISDIGKALADYATAHDMSAVTGNDGHGNRYCWKVVRGSTDHAEPDGKAAIAELERRGITVPVHTVKGRAASLRKA